MEQGKHHFKALLLVLVLLMAALCSQYTEPRQATAQVTAGESASLNFVIVKVGDFHAAIEWEDGK